MAWGLRGLESQSASYAAPSAHQLSHNPFTSFGVHRGAPPPPPGWNGCGDEDKKLDMAGDMRQVDASKDWALGIAAPDATTPHTAPMHSSHSTNCYITIMRTSAHCTPMSPSPLHTRPCTATTCCYHIPTHWCHTTLCGAVLLHAARQFSLFCILKDRCYTDVQVCSCLTLALPTDGG